MNGNLEMRYLGTLVLDSGSLLAKPAHGEEQDGILGFGSGLTRAERVP